MQNAEIVDCLPYINVEDALGRVRGNRAVFKSLLSVFLREDYCQKLQDQLYAGDLPSAAHTAHALKGVAANLSLRALYEAVLMVELRLKSEIPPDDMLARLMHTREETRRRAEQLLTVL